MNIFPYRGFKSLRLRLPRYCIEISYDCRQAKLSKQMKKLRPRTITYDCVIWYGLSSQSRSSWTVSELFRP